MYSTVRLKPNIPGVCSYDDRCDATLRVMIIYGSSKAQANGKEVPYECYYYKHSKKNNDYNDGENYEPNSVNIIHSHMYLYLSFFHCNSEYLKFYKAVLYCIVLYYRHSFE